MGRSGRGFFKRKKSWFQKGHALSPAKFSTPFSQAEAISPTSYIRPTHEQLQLAVTRDEQGFFCPSPDAAPSKAVMLLRPSCTHQATPVDKLQLKSRDDPQGGQKLQGYRFVDVNSAVDLGVQAALDHHRIHPDCDGQPKLIPHAEVRRGLAVSEMLSCQKCDFHTDQRKLYTEIPRRGRGRRTATPNMALQVGLQNTGIATAGARRLLTAMDTTVPSVNGLQKLSNKCGEIITAENERDMCNKRTITKDIHGLQGHDRNSPIAVETDRQYNNPLRNCRKKTPFVAATQTRDIVCENVTSSKYIVMYHHENKLCKKCDIANPGECQHTGTCSATRPKNFNMGDEREGGTECAKKLLNCKEPLTVNRVTTDADGCLAQGMMSHMQSEAGMETEHLLDPPHLNRSLCAAISRAKFSPKMFPGKRKKDRKKLQDRFADDISHRAEAEATLLQKSCKDPSQMADKAAKAANAIIQCYMGNHSLCKKWSKICHGKYKFPYLPVDARGKLRMCTSDEQTIVRLLGKRIGQEALEKTKYGTSTQKAESMNHAFAVTNPKGVLTFSRNASSRDHSAVHLVNNRHANSIVKKCEAAGCPVTAGSPAAKALEEMDKKQKYFMKRAKGKSYKKRRAQLRAQRFQLYYTTQQLYKRGQLDPKLISNDSQCKNSRERQIVQSEHNYCKRYTSK